MKTKTVLILFLIIFAVSLSAQTARADSIERVGACATDYVPWSLIMQDSFIYLADRGSFVIIDVSIPSTPWVRDVIEENQTDRTKMLAKQAFANDSLVYIRSNVFFTILNVINPDSAIIVGYTGGLPLTSGTEPRGLYVSDTIAFVPNGHLVNPSNIRKGVIVCNVKDPTNPSIVDSFPSHFAINLTMQDSLLFIAEYDSLLIVNAKDPHNLFKVSSLSIPEKAYDVAVLGNYAYVAGRSSYGTDGKVNIVSISDIQNPEVIGEMSGIRGDPIAVYLESGYIYVAAKDWWEPWKKREGKADVEGGVRVGYASPESSSVVTSYDTPGNSQDIYVVGDLIFVADYDSVQILRHIGAGVEESEKIQVQRVKLKVWPTPFERRANIEFTITSPVKGKIEMYDVSGRKIRTLYDGRLLPSKYRFYWNGKNDRGKEVVGGRYFITFVIDGLIAETKEVMYIK